MSDSVGVAFTGPDRTRIAGLTRVLEMTRRAAEGAAHPPTGVQNNMMLGGMAAGSTLGNAAFPVVGGVGLIARAYESVPVRNILLQIGKSKAGSPQEAVLITGC